MSLRDQINLRIVLTSLLILLLGGCFDIWLARGSVSKEIASSLNLAAQLIQVNFPKARQGGVDINDWLPSFVSLEQTRHLHIELQQADGGVVKFTADPKPEAADSPPDWFVKLVASDYPSLRQQVATVGGTVTLLIAADPMDEISEAWQESRAFFLSLCALSALTFLAANLVFNRAFKAIAMIVNGLQAIEQGEYRQKLPVFAAQEFARIAKAINHLTDVLDAAQRENSALALHSLRIQEEERRRLSQELHDELGQSLTAIKVMAVTLEKPMADSRKISAQISQVCDHLLAVVRSMMRHLHPLALAELGLKAGLEDLLGHWNSRYPDLALGLECPDSVDGLDPAVAIQVYRVAQECLTNIVRHAGAGNATVRLDLSPGDGLTLQVADDGRGCGDVAGRPGFGLLGMRERIKSLGGCFTVESLPGQGTCVTATIPLPGAFCKRTVKEMGFKPRLD